MGHVNEVPRFEKSWSKSLTIEVITSAAFRALGPSAVSVCIICFIKNDNAKFHKIKTADRRPIFTFPAVEAQGLLKISKKTFAAVLRQLEEHGLIDRYKQGGLLGASGCASQFCLSKGWKDWQPKKAHGGRGNIQKARQEKTKPK